MAYGNRDAGSRQRPRQCTDSIHTTELSEREGIDLPLRRDTAADGKETALAAALTTAGHAEALPEAVETLSLFSARPRLPAEDDRSRCLPAHRSLQAVRSQMSGRAQAKGRMSGAGRAACRSHRPIRPRGACRRPLLASSTWPHHHVIDLASVGSRWRGARTGRPRSGQEGEPQRPFGSGAVADAGDGTERRPSRASTPRPQATKRPGPSKTNTVRPRH